MKGRFGAIPFLAHLEDLNGRTDVCHIKRSYYKHEEAKARDYSLFVIACEGTKTEPSYFAPFDNFERIKVRLLEHKQTESAPSHVLASAKTI